MISTTIILLLLTVLVATDSDANESEPPAVFSPPAVNRPLAPRGDRTPAPARKSGLSRLVLAWDDRTLARQPAAYRVDATARVAMKFRVPDAQLESPGHLREVRPLPRWRIWAVEKNHSGLVRLTR
ncbi:MAG TPA: hypothetical protein VG936_16335 [Lacunisphaera sp.]|nr:hypothetical protein [Lacunisphaera sp.]